MKRHSCNGENIFLAGKRIQVCCFLKHKPTPVHTHKHTQIRTRTRTHTAYSVSPKLFEYFLGSWKKNAARKFNSSPSSLLLVVGWLPGWLVRLHNRTQSILKLVKPGF